MTMMKMMRGLILSLLVAVGSAETAALPPIPAPGTYAVCNICPSGQAISLPNGILDVVGNSVTCAQLSKGGLQGSIPPVLCALVPTLPVVSTCGCKKKSPVKTPTKKPVKTPTKKPVKTPIKTPIKTPVKSPIKKPA